MPSDKQQTSNKGVQTDSAQPSRFRSRVRSLLGIPADEAGHLAFSPPTPPVGFRYADAPSMSEPQMDSAWIELEDFQEANPEDFQPHASIEEPPDVSEMSQGSALEEETELMIPESKPKAVSVELTERSELPNPGIEQVRMEVPSVSRSPSTAPGMAHAKKDDAPEVARPQQDLPKQTGNQYRPRPESKPESVVVEETQNVGTEDVVPEVERASMEIPGVSERPLAFPSLTHAKEDDAPEVPPPQQDLPTRTVDQQGTRIESKPQPAQDVRPQAIAPEVERSSMEIPGVSERSPTFPASSLANEVAPPSDGTEDRSSWQDSVGPSESASPINTTNSLAWGREMGNKETQGKRAGEQGSRIAEEGGSKEESELKPNMPMSALSRSPLSPHSASQPFGTEAVSRSNRDTAETIEQLRHALQELNSKVASQQEKMNGEGRVREAGTRQQPPEQPPSPPPQTVVIIKRSSHPERTPRAFWERSYLSRFHRRPLR